METRDAPNRSLCQLQVGREAMASFRVRLSNLSVLSLSVLGNIWAVQFIENKNQVGLLVF